MRKFAFTLVELLVVISVIIILASIMVPTVGKALQTATKAKATAYLKGIEVAANEYHSDNGLYPGQDRTNDIGRSSSELSGSQMLAVCLLDGLNADNISGRAPGVETGGVKSNYISYKEDETTANIENRNYTLTDMWKPDELMAMLYYPSQIGNDGTADAFVYNDNSDYLSGSSPETSTGFSDAIEDTRFGGNRVYNSDTFILISPSVDREYFTDDDIRNFKK